MADEDTNKQQQTNKQTVSKTKLEFDSIYLFGALTNRHIAAKQNKKTLQNKNDKVQMYKYLSYIC